MPQAYVTRLKTNYTTRGVEWLAINSQLRVKFELSIDHRYPWREESRSKSATSCGFRFP